MTEVLIILLSSVSATFPTYFSQIQCELTLACECEELLFRIDGMVVLLMKDGMVMVTKGVKQV